MQASLRLRGDEVVGGGGRGCVNSKTANVYAASRVAGACNFIMYLLPMPIHTS